MVHGLEVNKRGAILTFLILASICYILYSRRDETEGEISKQDDVAPPNKDKDGKVEGSDKNDEYDVMKHLPVKEDKDEKLEIGEGVEYVEDVVLVKGIHVHYKYAVSTLKDASKPRYGVLLLHGAAFSSETWKNLGTLQRLCKEYFPVAVDLPGKGKTTSTYSGDPSSFLHELIGALGKLPNIQNFEKPVVVSPSMSGRYSIPYVFEHGDNLRGYIPVAPVIDSDKGEDDFKKVKVPTLVIYGGNDYAGKLNCNKLLNIPNSEKLEIPDARHPAYLDNPDLFHDKILEFLNNIYVKEKAVNTSH